MGQSFFAPGVTPPLGNNELFIGIGIGAVIGAIAVIIVVIIINKKK